MTPELTYRFDRIHPCVLVHGRRILSRPCSNTDPVSRNMSSNLHKHMYSSLMLGRPVYRAALPSCTYTATIQPHIHSATHTATIAAPRHPGSCARQAIASKLLLASLLDPALQVNDLQEGQGEKGANAKKASRKRVGKDSQGVAGWVRCARKSTGPLTLQQ